MADAFQLFTSALQVVDTVIKLTQLAVDAKNAPADIQTVQRNVTSLRAVLETLNEQSWTDGLDRLDEVVTNFLYDLGKIKLGLEEYTGYDSSTISEKSSKPKSHLSVRKRLAWVIYGSKEFQSALANLERYKTSFTLAMNGYIRKAVDIGFQILQDTQKATEERLEDLRAVLQRVDEDQNAHLKITQSKEERKERKAIEAWLSSLDYRETQNSKSETRSEGTGTWILEDPRFQEWKSGSSKTNTLWCHGEPGAGKSFISSLIIDELEETVGSTNAAQAVAFLYCNYKEQDPEARDYLLCILKQLVKQRPSIPSEVKASYEKHQIKNSRPQINEVSKLLKSVSASFERVYIVIDALDECTRKADDQQITKGTLIEKLNELTKGTVSLIVTSRETEAIKKLFAECPALEITAHEDDLRVFIRSYIADKNARLAKKVAGREELKQRIIDKVLEVAQKKFLFARRLLEYIGQQHSPKQVELSLEKLPDSLDSTYDDALSRLGNGVEANRQLAMQVLGWLAKSLRPLSVEELREALAASIPNEDDELGYDKDNMVDEEDIVDHCEGLIMRDANGQIRFIHKSFQDYLEKKEELLPISEADVAKACIRYLSTVSANIPKEVYEPQSEITAALIEHQNELLKPYHFLSYATHHWGSHADWSEALDEDDDDDDEEEDEEDEDDEEEDCDGDEDEDDEDDEEVPFDPKLDQYVRSILYEKSDTLTFASFALARLDEGEELDTTFDVGVLPDKSISPLHIAAFFGLTRYVRESLGRGYAVDLADEDGNTALHLAAYYDFDDIARLLLKQDGGKALINVPNKHGMTPLQYAISEESEDTLKVLQRAEKKKGSKFDFNSVDERGETPLTIAASRGSTDRVVKLLEDPNLDPNLPNQADWTPLRCAVEYGKHDVIRTLLARADVNVNAIGPDGTTPLSQAVEEEDEEALQLLFQRPDIEVNSLDSRGYSPLHSAVEKKTPAIVASLLERPDVRLDLRNNDGLTPMEIATKTGNIAIISMLRIAERYSTLLKGSEASSGGAHVHSNDPELQHGDTIRRSIIPIHPPPPGNHPNQPHEPSGTPQHQELATAAHQRHNWQKQNNRGQRRNEEVDDYDDDDDEKDEEEGGDLDEYNSTGRGGRTKGRPTDRYYEDANDEDDEDEDGEEDEDEEERPRRSHGNQWRS